MGAVTIALIGFFVFLIMRVTTPQMTPLFTDLAYEDSAAIVKELDRQAVPYELRNDGNIVLVPKDRVARLRMSVRRRRPAQGRRRRLRDFRQVGGARHHELRAEHQQCARARGRARPHHPLARSRPGRPRASGDARPAAVLARQGRCHRVHRAQGARHAGAASGPRHPPPRRRRRQRAAAGAGIGRRRARPAPGRRRRQRSERRRRLYRRAAGRVREAPAQPGRGDRLVGRRPEPCPRPGRRRFRFQPRHPDLGQIRPRGPRRPLQPDARGNLGDQRRQGEPGHGRQRDPGRRSAKPRPAAPTMPRPRDESQQIGGDRQLRDFQDHQDRGDRRRPAQSRLGRGRWSTAPTARTTRAKAPISRAARKRSTRSPRWCARRSASTRSAATRSRSSICALPRRRPRRSPSRAAGCRRSSSPKTTSCAPSKWW